MTEEAEKNGKYQLDQNLVDKINEITTTQQVPQFEVAKRSVLQEVIPEFFTAKFIIADFSKKKKQKATIYSPVEKHEGSE